MVLELDLHEHGPDIQNELMALTGQRTVPNVFVSGRHVGGADDTSRAMQSGQLAQLLSQSDL